MTLKFLLFFCLGTLPGWAQRFRLDTTVYLPQAAGIHTVSGLAFIPSAGVWQLAGDKGDQWRLANLLRYNQATRGASVGARLEALRYDDASHTYFGTVEDDNQANVSYAFFTTDSLFQLGDRARLVRFDSLAPLPFVNKGLEGLALGADSTVWIAPEAGWTPADSARPTIAFHRYRWSGTGLSQKQSFTYPRDRFPQVTSSERFGGISEILWAGKNRLLVLERYYSSRLDSSFAKLYEVRFNEAKPTAVPTKKLVFNFNTGLGGRRVDNLEGMAWAPTRNGRRVLVLISDDNGGVCPPAPKKCQQTQLIFLSRKEP